MCTAEAVSIRIAAAGDDAALADLSTQLGYPTDAAAMAERLARVRDGGEGEIFVAADANAGVVGWAHVVPRLHLEEGAFAELAGLIVDAGARGRGVGAALLRAGAPASSAGTPTRRRVRYRSFWRTPAMA